MPHMLTAWTNVAFTMFAKAANTEYAYIFATLANMSKSNVSRCSDNATVSNSNSI